MTYTDRQLTAVCAQLVHRLYNNTCAYPGCSVTGETVQVAHILGKGAYAHWRFSICNQLPLCHHHHSWYDGRCGSKLQHLAQRELRGAHGFLFAECDKLKRITPEPWTPAAKRAHLQQLKQALEDAQ